MSEARSQVLRGIAAMLIAVLAFALMDAGLKVLSPHYAPLQVASLRALASLPLVLVWCGVSGGYAQLLRVRWSLHLLRAGLSVLMLGAFAYALRTLPLADAYSIFFVAPLMITALAVPFLGEKVGWRRWSAIGVGLMGVLIVLKPSGSGWFTPAGFAVLAAAFGYSVNAITVRKLGLTDSVQAMVFWMLTLTGLIAAVLVGRHWELPHSEHWLIIAGVGIAGALGQVAITEAFRRAPASTLAPLEYTALIWGLVLDWIVWSTAPNLRMLVGASVIVLSGLYLIHRERIATH
jgi:drug/metabolite transporter (DMT)-like permease